MIRRTLLAAALGALALTPAAQAGTPVDAACDSYVWVGEGYVQSGGEDVVRTEETTVRLGDHTGVLGDQDPCAA